MSRPARLRANLLDKISRKETRTPGKKPGKKAKAWRKWAEHYKAAAEGTHAAPAATPAT